MNDSIQYHLKCYCEESKISDVGRRCAELLDRWVGLHHLEPNQLKKVDWSHSRFIIFKLHKYGGVGTLATHDFNDLTRLVFLAHDLCIRVQLSGCNQQYMELMLHPRTGREGGIAQRHPTLEQAVGNWRAHNPAPLDPAEHLEGAQHA